MKISQFMAFQKRAQSAVEYLVLLGLVLAVTLWAFDTLLPHIVSADGNSGSAVKFFANITRKITE